MALLCYCVEVFLQYFFLLFSLSALAGSWTDASGVVWNFDTDWGSNKASITGASNYPADVVIPDTVYNGTTAYEVYRINGSQNLFCEKKDIRSVKKVKEVEIDYMAFYNCTALATVDVAATKIGEYAFYGCTALRNVVLSGPTTEIQKQAFSGCTALMKIHLPSTLTTVGEEAFNGCTA